MAIHELDYSPDADWNRIYVDGEWYSPEGRDSIPVEDPSTRETFTEVPACQTEEVEDAYAAAEAAQDDWAATSYEDRVAILEDAVDILQDRRSDFMELLAVEAGSAVPKAMGEFEYARGITQYMADLDESPHEPEEHPSDFDGKKNFVIREPAGTIGIISPWNWPLFLAMRSVAPAIATGNTMVLKPSTETPITGALAIAALFDEAGLPDGVLNVVTGRGSDIGDDISSHPVADVMSFTGSTPIGKRVSRLAADQLTLPALELGGNAPYVVCEDSDLDVAIKAGLFGSFMHQGQICISINRHLVHEDVYDEYVERFTAGVEDLIENKMGDPQDAQNIIGPIINESQRDEILRYIEETVEAGATLEAGGGHDGLFVEPTVLSGATNDMAAACNEHFGPVCPIIPFGSDDEAVAIANDTEYGLSAAVHSGDVERARSIAERIDAGMVHVNDQPIHDEPHMPFGGMKDSGMGRYNGDWIIEEFTETKWISEQHEERNYMVF